MRASILSGAVLLSVAAGWAWAAESPPAAPARASSPSQPLPAARGAASAPAPATPPAGGATQAAARPPARAPSPDIYESPAPPVPANEIDRIVFAKLATLNIRPVLCSDAVFVRRVFLDLLGTLPTAKEAADFLRDPDSQGKRRALIDRLLQRDEFADYWAMKWGDILRIKAEFPVNLWPNAAQAYHRWVRASLAENKRYDQFARELLTSSGSNFRVAPVNFYRAIQNKTPEGIAAAVALAFMGSRIDSWPKDRAEGMAVFFSQVGYKPTREWKEEIVYWDPFRSAVAQATGAATASAAPTAPASPSASDAAQAPAPPPAPAGPLMAMFPDGTKVRLTGDRDPREVFADWLITPKNPWFARCAVNRTWAWLLGRGIIHEPDDIRDNNPPSNPALLAYLEKEFIAGGYDVKRLVRLIVNSCTYQASSRPLPGVMKAEAHFARYPLRRLEAEVLIDAVNKITGASDLYTSPIPEPFTYIPQGMPAVCIADGSITSPFLALFGRSARATGMENERDNKMLPAHWLHMLNSSHIQQKLEQGPRLKAIVEAKRRPEETLEELYLTILSRFPTPEEVETALRYSGGGTGAPSPPPKYAAPSKSGPPGKTPAWTPRRDDWTDIAWALINSTEFLYRH